ncbi:hypothetical protein [Deinococcus roseus]|uniref:Uncharacterized protein n=1 Tax=Deinococcus roseus TaxID=392414 RepID=A0ABQ2D6H5_9DEIO|nr:hypothetical protein [Deinococcus roseus]GGJ47806.1 hypothetical protein GCM10008938_37250 [Deinococcus roseus]
MDFQVFGERLSVTVLEQDDRLKLLTGVQQTQTLLDAFDVQELVWVDGFCCQIVLLEYTEWKATGFLHGIYLVDLVLEVVGEEA